MWAGRLALQHPINCSLHLLSLSSLMLFSMDLSSTAVLQYWSTNPFFQGPFLPGLWIFFWDPGSQNRWAGWLPALYQVEIHFCDGDWKCHRVSRELIQFSLLRSLRVEGRSNPGLQVTGLSQCDGLTLHHTHPGWGLGWGPITIFMLSWHRLPPPPSCSAGVMGPSLSDARQRYSIHGSKIICMYSLYFSSPSSQFSLSESNIAQDRPG